MKKSIFVLTASVFTFATIVSAEAQTKPDSTSKTAPTQTETAAQDTSKSLVKSKVVGGATMLPTSDIIENTSKSKEHTTLVEAIQTAGLTDTLKASGPFTVFAPTNDAFAKLPA